MGSPDEKGSAVCRNGAALVILICLESGQIPVVDGQG
jgi:hypothetical protein